MRAGRTVSATTTVSRSSTASYSSRKSPLRRHFVKATVKVHQCPDGGLAIFHGRLCLARYDDKGLPIGEPGMEGPPRRARDCQDASRRHP